MLLSDFYSFTMVAQNTETLRAVITLNPRHEIFSGHFPDTPIVPGVCQVQMVKEVINHALNNDFRLLEAKEIKFLSLINPVISGILDLELKLSETSDQSIKVAGFLSDQGKTCLKIRGVFGER